ncbi:MAG: ABC transporter ATP-binding protein [Syntrophomonas sp.]
MGASVTVEEACKNYGTLQVIDRWSLNISGGERLVILGPSGAGKTTFLRLIAGLENLTSGSIRVSSKQVGFVFQEPRLIPWRTVKQNLLFVNQEADVDGMLSKLKLTGFENYLPAQLSGGMQQRVNLARALIVDPRLLILDEAFGSLDLRVKLSIIRDIIDQWQEKRFTMVAVTHDLKEALCIADSILIVSSRPSQIVHRFSVHLERGHRAFTDPELLRLESELLSIMSEIQ